MAQTTLYLDIPWEIKTSVKFRNQLSHLTRQLLLLEREKNAQTSEKERGQIIMQILRLCDWNPGLLVPYFFPHYPKSEPLSLFARPFSFAMFNLQIGGFTVIRASRQVGKEQPDSAPVLTPQGWRRIGDIRTGDEVVGSNGLPASVTAVFEQGESDVYCLEFSDGGQAQCGWQHHWTVQHPGSDAWEVVTTENIVEQYGWRPGPHKTIRIPVASPIRFATIKGSSLSHPDDHPDAILRHQQIPQRLLMDSVTRRIQLLRSLVEKSGEVHETHKASIPVGSFAYGQDILLLTRSLGGVASLRKDGQQSIVDVALNPETLGYAFANSRISTSIAARKLISIHKIGKEKSRCLEVNSSDHTYITSDMVVTHNSTSFVARQKILSDLIPSFRSLYVVPHQEHLDTFANRYRELERVYRFPAHHPQYRQNLTYKESLNKSIVEMIRVLSSAHSARGKTTDELLMDEYQHFDDSLLLEVQQTQKASDKPSTIFAGTSLTIDSALEARWNQSSQGAWHLLCDCGKSIDCSKSEEIIPLIQPRGPTCPKCSRVINVTQGRWLHESERQLEAGLIGFHVPQIIIPEYANQLEKWADIYRDYNESNLAKFLQEICGIATEESARELTKEDLQRMCCLPDSKASLQNKAITGKYQWVLSACDWGGSDYIPAFQQKISTTVHVVMGVLFNGDMDIIHMRRYDGMGYREIITDIVREHTRLNAGPIATDFGVGAAYNMLLREHKEIHANRHLIFSYVGPNSAVLAAPQKESMYNQFSVNRTETISTLFNAIKRTRTVTKTIDGKQEVEVVSNPRVRCYAWEEASPFLNDFLNLLRVPTESSLGVNAFKYRRHGSKPDDTLHAVNFGYILGRILRHEPILEDSGLKEMLQERIGGAFRRSVPLGRKLRTFSG